MNTHEYIRVLVALVGALAFACASAELTPAVGTPTDAKADQAPLPHVASALAPNFDPLALAATSTAKSVTHDHSQHDHSQHDHSQHDRSERDAAQEAAPQPDVVRYTCPMHPEVVRDAPGNCPICGMHLVPVKPSKTMDGDTGEGSATQEGGH